MPQVRTQSSGTGEGPHCRTCGTPEELVGTKSAGDDTGRQRETWMCQNGHLRVALTSGGPEGQPEE
jgi:hypothetical protein